MKNSGRNLISGAAAFLMLWAAAPAFSQGALAGAVPEQIAAIQSLIREKGGKWVAGENSLSNLSEEEWRFRVGLNFQPVDAPPIGESAAAAPPPVGLDWRDNNGNYVSAVTDQKKCGSCWAFAMTAGLESYVLLTPNNAGPVDLSEQVMLSCSGVGSCSGGYMNAGFLQRTGLPPEIFYPYTATNGSCSAAAPGWQKEAEKIAAWGSVAKNLAAIKAALAANGPLPTAFYVYEDFKFYKSGIYSYTTGKLLGGHAVLLVGYNDPEKYFIVKNSWGPGWGEEGFFRIAYSEMNNSVSFGMSTIAYRSKNAKGAALWQAGKPEPDLSGESEAWARTAPMFQPLLQWSR